MNAYFRLALAALIVLTSLAGSISPSTAQRGQQDTTFVSEFSGLTIDIGDSGFAQFKRDSYEIVDISRFQKMERIYIDVGWSELLVTFMNDNGIDPVLWNENSINIVSTANFHELVILGEAATSEEGWNLTKRVQHAGTEEVHFSETSTDIGNGHAVGLGIFSHETTLVEHITWARENITIDGIPLFPETDLEAIQAMLDGTSDIEPVSVENEYASLSDWSDHGLQSETEWHNYLHGSVVTWDPANLYFPYAYDRAIEYWEENEQSRIFLLDDQTKSSTAIVFAKNDEARSGQDWEERWSGAEWLSNASPDRSVLGSASEGDFAGVIYSRFNFYGKPIIIFRVSVNLPGGNVAWAEISTTPEVASRAYSNSIEGMLIDGASMVRLWSNDEIDEMVGDLTTAESDVSASTASEATPDEPARTSRGSSVASSPEADDSLMATSDWSDLGLISDTEWHSPISNTTFSWDGEIWVFAGDLPDAITVDDEFTTVTLNTSDGRGQALLSTDTSGVPIDVWYEALLSDDYALSMEDDDVTFTVLDNFTDGTTASVIVLHHSIEGDNVVIIDIYENEDGVTILTEITAAPEDIADVYATFWDSVQSDGEFYPLTWTLEDIERLHLD